jgi:diguanylate cyclase (GGDEF)-like protein
VLAARLGGDEFGVLVPGAGERDAMHYATGLGRAVAENRSPDGLAVTASLGVVTVEQPGLDADAVLQSAATAMYEAKGRGRNCAVHYRELEREAARAGSDVQVRAFEVHQRLVTERATENITLRGRILLDELQKRADRDSLTGLFNRGYLDRRLPRDCEEARGAARPLCVALIDVDHFGQVNKKYGWPTGDQTLRDVAAVIRQHVRAGDWVAKYGGEEIAVVMEATPEEAAAVVERVRAAVARHPFRTTTGAALPITVSAGVVAVRPGEGAADVWERVSRKVLDAKEAGRNQVRA